MPKFLTVAEAARALPGRPHKNTIFRWMKTGAEGVVLRSIRVGARRFTSEAWISDFIRESSAKHGPADADHLSASAELDRLGV